MSDSTDKPGGGLRKLALDATGTFGTRVITMVLGLGTGIITARMLGPEARGIFSLVSLFPATIVTLSKFGQSQSTIYFIRRERVDVSQIASNVLLFAIVVGAVLVATSVLCRDLLVGSILKGVPVWALLVVLPLIPILLVESYLYGILQATDRFRVYNTRVLGESVFTLALMAVVLVGFGLGLEGALAVTVSIRFFMAGWVVMSVNRDTPVRGRFSVSLFGRMMRYGTKSHIQIIASHFHFKAVTYMVAYFLDPTQVAFYAIASRLAEQIMYVPQSLGLALFPRLASSEPERVHSMTAQACRQTVAVTAAMALVLALAGKFLIVTLYGVSYASAAVPLPYICIGIVMMSLYVLLSRNFTSRNRQVVNIVAAYVALGGNIGANIFLIPSMGIEGAAIATASSYSLAALILLVFFVKESGLAWHEAVVLRGRDVVMWRRLAADLWTSLRPARA